MSNLNVNDILSKIGELFQKQDSENSSLKGELLESSKLHQKNTQKLNEQAENLTNQKRCYRKKYFTTIKHYKSYFRNFSHET